MHLSRRATRIAVAFVPLLASAWIAACAADVGDPSEKDALGLTGGDGATTGPGDSSTTTDAAQPGQDGISTVPPQGDSSTVLGDSLSSSDSTSPPADSTPPVEDTTGPVDDTTSPPVDSGPPPPVDTGPPPTGCAAGATVIALTGLTPSSPNFGAGAVCVTLHGNVPTGWNASNVTGRTVTAVGSTTQTPTISGPNLGNQPPIAAGADGYVYWNWSAGSLTYADMGCF